MKKLGYLTCAALLAFASCTNEINEEGFVDKANTISFNAYANKTRAYTSGDINSATAMQDGTFGVVGYFGNSIYLGSESKAIAQCYNSEKSHWEYHTPDELKFWPNGNMDFYAYFPYAASGDAFASSNSSEGTVMTINNTTGNQDVLIASAINRSYIERIPLNFYHAFSKVKEIKIKVALNDVDVTVSRVEFINTTSSANSQILVNKDGKASYGNSTGEACGLTLSSPVTISTTLNNVGYMVWNNEANKYLLSTQGIVENNNVTGTNKNMWDGTKTLLTDGKTLETLEQVCLKITGKVKYNERYYVGDNDNDGVFYIPLKGTNHTTVGDGDTRNDLEHFFAGKRYSYNIIMKDNVGFKEDGDPILKPILFSVNSVDAWDDVTVTITL